MTTIAEALTAGRRAMAANEVTIVQALLEQYAVAWRNVEARLREVEGMIEAAIARGETVDDAWLRRQLWWDGTLRSIEQEMSAYTSRMAQTLAQGQIAGITTASQASTAMAQYIAAEAAKRGISIGGVIRPGVNANAFERWVIAQRPGSPVRQAIDRYGVRVSDSIITRMTEGLAAGEHPRTITRRIVADVGTEAVEGRIHTITRTETHRAYRGALKDNLAPLEQSGAIVGYRWSAALGPRTCSACLAMHGRVFEHYPMSQHVACRCVASPVVNPEYAPTTRTGRTGEEWLRDQPADVQRRILRTEDRYQAFREGYTLDDFTGIRRDPVWGESVRVKPMREVRAR